MSIESVDSERRKAIEADEARPSEMVGSSVQRREDPHLISGDAEYTDDIQYPRETHLAILRSQYGHARIEGIDTSEAEDVDGVVGVFTQEDVEASGASGTVRTDSPDNGTSPEQPLLARDHVTYQGQAIAGVVAEDRYTAHDAIDKIEVEYERLDAVAKPREAIADDAPTIHEDAPDNVAFEWENGDKEATEEAFEDADHTVEFDLEINKVIPTAMEPRAAVARYRGSTDELTVEMSTQNPHTVQDDLSDVLNIPDNRIRVRPPDVGGGFGAKLQPYTGHLLAAWCSTQLKRPVKWVSTRSDDCQSMVHSRYQDITASAALDDAGNILAIKAESLADVGGYIAPGGSGVPQNLGLMISGQYAIPTGYVEMTGTFTNTTPLAAYRGAGRPEATYFIERLVDVAASELDMDPVEFRKQNFIPSDAFPYETGFEHTYDSGDYANTLDVALDHVNYEAVRERQEELRDEDRYLGIGISCYVEACGAAPGWPETGTVQFKPSGNVVLKSGTAEIGTGHRTGYTQIAAAVLGVDYEDIEVIEGDTAMVTEGNGTGGSRAMPVGGSAIRESSVDVREKARKIAAHQLEAAEEDLEFEDGEFAIRGAPDRSISIQEVADIAYDPDALPEDIDPGLEATTIFDPADYTYPFGAHIAVVEVDPESGEVEFEDYIAVDDVGNQINPKLVEGQIHGGVVQSIGQALQEEAVYDDNGNLLTATLQDYAVPKAEHVPDMRTDTTVTPCPHNQLGVKGVGEAGTIGATPAVVNAVVDALDPFGIDHLDMPLTPERIWQAVRDADVS